MAARSYVSEAISGNMDVTLNELELSEPEYPDIAIVYNTKEAPWSGWYMDVVNSIYRYYDENFYFPRYNARLFEVVSRTQPYISH